MLYVEKYNRKNLPKDAIIINTTSQSPNWSKGLSPFFLEGGNLYGGFYSANVENAWQASKVYKEYIGLDGNPSKEYFNWAQKIWQDTYAHRYPMGRGAIPEYSYWDGEKLTYVEARKKIYIPIYSRAVLKSEAFEKLSEIYQKEERDIYLIDFDGYNHRNLNKTIEQVINDPREKMGHAFVIFDLLIKKYGDKKIQSKTLF